MLVRVLTVAVALAAAGCSAGSRAAPVDDDGSGSVGSAVLVLGDEIHEFRVMERCMLAADGDVRVKAVGIDDEALRLEVSRAASPVVEGDLVDEITVTRDRAPWVTQAVPVTTVEPTPLFAVDGTGLVGEAIEFRRTDEPVATVAGSLEVTCP